MRPIASSLLFAFIATAGLTAPVASAQNADLQPPVESSKVVGPYEILYSVMPTTFISEQIAASYRITRARDQALINVSIRKKEGDGDVAHAAAVTGKYSDLMQSKPLEFREIREQGAIYYIAAFRHADKELLRFDLNVALDPQRPAQTVTFTRKLFIDEDE